jgi:O-antigen ligase
VPSEDQRGGAAWIDGVAFAIFAGYVVLAFTTAFPEQFALPKLLGVYLYAGFCAFRWALALRRGRVQALDRKVWLPMLALALWWTAATFTAQHVQTALFGLRGRYNGLAAMLVGLALLLFIATTRTTAREIEQRLGAICVALTAASLYALVQSAGLDRTQWPEGRPPSTLGHPVILGGALAMGLPVTLALALDGRSRISRWAWSAMSILQGLALTLTLARGPWAGAVCGLAVFAALSVPRRRALAPRMAAMAIGAVLAVTLVLAASAPERGRVFERVLTLTRLSGDSSLSYRAHFGRAALAMLRDHPLTGVGWENFGLLYPKYRSSPTASIGPDLVPTMVHSGPLQTAVSGGLPALVLQMLFFVGIGTAVAGRTRAEADERQRMLGAAFLAAGLAYLVQDLSGWPHVALGTLAFVLGGLGVAWSLGARPRACSGSRWPLTMLAAAIGAGSAWMSFDTWQRIRAERLMYEAQQLNVQRSWTAVERKVEAALDASPDKAWASDAAARLYGRRALAAGDRRAYERGVALARAARVANPFDPYIVLRRAELDLEAMGRGLLTGVTDEGRDFLDAAKSMTPDSTLVRKVETALLRRGGRILWIEPQASAGFGPAGSLVVAGSAPGALAGTHVFLHWRDATGDAGWTTESNAPVPDAEGGWYNAIPNADPRHRYEVYATCETWSYGPCIYAGTGAIQLCSPLAMIGPRPAGADPAGSLFVGGTAPDAAAAADLFLHWRNATRPSSWAIRPFRSTGAGEGVSFPPDAPGNWYAVIPNVRPGEKYQAYIASRTALREPCTYDGHPTLCSPIAWIQPQATAGFGPPGSLVVAGSLPKERAGAPVFLHWRNVTAGSAWTTEAFAPTPDAWGDWTNAIPSANPLARYEVSITAPTAASNRCTYGGDGTRNVCP